jgi:hypothetical protein
MPKTDEKGAGNMLTTTKKMVESLDGLLHQPSVLFRRGRFACVDTYQAPPADPVALHKYLYAGADPVNNSDPSGESYLDLLGGALITAAPYVSMAGQATAAVGLASMVAGAADYYYGSLSLDIMAASGSTNLNDLYSAVNAQMTGVYLMATGAKFMAVGIGLMTMGALMTNVGTMMMLGGTGAAGAALANGGFGNLQSASNYWIRSYDLLTRALQGTGLKAHHIIEKRFASLLGVKEGDMLSVAVTDAEHAVFTQKWVAAICHGVGTSGATRERLWEFAQRIYADYPALLAAAKAQLRM